MRIFSFDEDLARQINALLQKEKSGIVAEDELAVTELVERLLKDGKRRKAIVRHLRRLQGKKR